MMTGEAIIDAVASLLGMKEVDATDTVPNRTHVLSWVNEAAKEIAAGDPQGMWTLIVKETQADSPHSDVFAELAVVISDTNAVQVSLHEYFSKKNFGYSDKPLWAYGLPSSNDMTILISVGTDYDLYFIGEPAYVDDANPPADGLPEKYVPDLIKRAAVRGKLHENDNEGAALLGGRRSG